jgi:transducin (beta)-like 1
MDHAAFALRNEAQLEATPNYQKHIPHGELVELLGKALLFIEVEKHWAGNNQMITNCISPFSLLEEHTCTVDPTLQPTVSLSKAIEAESSKRKINDDYDSGQVVKRPRAEPTTASANGARIGIRPSPQSQNNYRRRFFCKKFRCSSQDLQQSQA